MNVRGTFRDGIMKDLLDELDDRRIVHLGRGIAGRLDGDLFIELDVEVVFCHFLQRRFRALDQLGNQRRQFVGLDDHGIDGQTGLETDLVQSSQVRRIGQGDGEAVATAYQGHHLVVGHDPAVDGFLDDVFLVECVEVEQRVAESLGSECSDFPGGQPTGRHHLGHETATVRFGVGGDALGIGLPEATLLHQGARQPAQSRGVCGSHCINRAVERLCQAYPRDDALAAVVCKEGDWHDSPAIHPSVRGNLQAVRPRMTSRTKR